MNRSPIPFSLPQSQEVRQLYPQNSLSGATLFALLTLLPIPAYALHHWWHLKNRRSLAVAQAVERLGCARRKTNLCNEQEARKPWLKRLRLSWLQHLRLSLSGAGKRSSQSQSALPRVVSPFSMNVSPSQQRSSSSAPEDKADGPKETMGQKLPGNSGQ